MATEMTPVQNLYYAIGEVIYAIACADGRIQREEKQKFHDIVISEDNNKNYDFNFSEIIFKIMEKDETRLQDAYNRAMKQIRLNSHYLSPKMKSFFVSLLGKIAAAYPPVTRSEKHLIDNFAAEISSLEGDPVYYGHVK